jgi:hypothetical protein
VITVDHVPKNPENRGKGGIGAQQKRALTDGCSILVEVVEPFGKGQSGVLRLAIDKDRHGKVRGISTGGKVPGKVTFTSILETVELVIEPPEVEIEAREERHDEYLAGLMETVSRLLEDLGGEVSQRQVREATIGKTASKLEALNNLVALGCVKQRSGPQRAIVYSSVKPYQRSTFPISQTFPGHFPEMAKRAFPPSPSPLGGETIAGNGNDAERAARNTPRFQCRRCGDQISETEDDELSGLCRSCDRVENP